MYQLLLFVLGASLVRCQEELTFPEQFPNARFDCDPLKESCDWLNDGWTKINSTASNLGEIELIITQSASELEQLTTNMDVKFFPYMTDIMSNQDIYQQINSQPDTSQAAYEYAVSREVRFFLLPSNKSLATQRYFYVLELHTDNEPDSKVLQCQPNINYTARSFTDIDGQEFQVPCAVIFPFEISKFFANMSFEISETMIKVWEHRHTDRETSVLNLFVEEGMGVKYFSISSRFPGVQLRINTTDIVNTTEFTSPPFLIQSGVAVCHKEIFTATAIDKEAISVSVLLSDGKAADLDGIKPTAIGEQISEQKISTKTDNEIRLKLIATSNIMITAIRNCVDDETPSEQPSTEAVTETTTQEIDNSTELEITKVVLMAKDSTSAVISWPAPAVARVKPITYTVRYQCKQYLACNVTCSSTVEQLEVDTPSATLKPLLPYSEYVVNISTPGGPEITRILETKMSDPPTEIPATIDRKLVMTNNTITLFWSPVPVCSGVFREFVYQIYEAGNKSSVLYEGTTNETEVTFPTDPETDYTVNVFVETAVGFDQNRYLEFNVSAEGTIKAGSFGPFPSLSSNATRFLTSSIIFYVTFVLVIIFILTA